MRRDVSVPLAVACAALVLCSSPSLGATSRAARPKPKSSPAPVADQSKTTAAASDSGTVLKGGQEGTAFKSLTVEGEDKIQIEFERPPLNLDLDPNKAPGLDWGTAKDVLDRTVPDLTTPLLQLSSQEHSPFLGRPWLDRFRTGPVATFHPDLKEVERWSLLIADSRGKTVASFGGKGSPPRDIVWDGRAKDGTSVIPGLTYSYVLEAFDRAGNKRNFVGEGFQVSTYRVDTPQGPVLAFSGQDLKSSETSGWNASNLSSRASGPSAAPMLVLEAASWLNQSGSPRQPIKVTATARSYEQANALASGVAHSLAPLLLGDPSRVQPVTDVQPDAPADGAVTITPGH